MTKTVLELFREKAIAAQVVALEAKAIAIAHEKLLLEKFSSEVYDELYKHFQKPSGMFELNGTAHDGVYEYDRLKTPIAYVDYDMNMWVIVMPVEFTKAKKRKAPNGMPNYFRLDFILQNAVEVDPKDYSGKNEK